MTKLKQTLLLLSSFSLAQAGWSVGYLYMGLGAGPDTAQIIQNAHVQPPGTNVFDKQQEGLTGAFMSIFGGYGYHHERVYFGGELNLTGSSLDNKSSNYETVHQAYSQTIYKIPANVGISFLPGYEISQFLLAYARLGYAKGHFIVDTSDTSLQHLNTWLDGFRYGLGLQAMLNEHVDLRLEWSHINYQTDSMLYVGEFTTKSTKVTPHTNQFEFAAIYVF